MGYLVTKIKADRSEVQVFSEGINSSVGTVHDFMRERDFLEEGVTITVEHASAKDWVAKSGQ